MKWISYLKRKQKVKQLFKAYGKELYKERINYVESFIFEPELIIQRTNRHLLRRCILVAVILILTMSLLVAGAKTFHLEVPVFRFFEKDDHVEVYFQQSGDGISKKEFFDIGYVPEGYEYQDIYVFEDIYCISSYVNKKSEYLYVTQELTEKSITNINNENCKQYTEMIDDIEVHIYDYNDGNLIYLYQKQGVLITIQAHLDHEEMKKIMRHLK